MKPSDFTQHPDRSVMREYEAEVVARNIMVILKRTGNKFRKLSWDEYKEERAKDGDFSPIEKPYFKRAIRYCESAQTAVLFSPTWDKAANPTEKDRGV